MKFLKFNLLILIALLTFSANAQNEKENNSELSNMYKQDQAERTSGEINWPVVSKNDSIRRARVNKMMEEGEVQTAQDYYNAAMIFQHGSDTIASGKAVKYMKKAVAMDPNTNKWLLGSYAKR